VAEAAARDQGSVWEAACRAVAEARAALADREAAAAALAQAVPAVVAPELMPAICGVRRGVVAEAREAALVVPVAV
jgi:hypothetical protein